MIIGEAIDQYNAGRKVLHDTLGERRSFWEGVHRAAPRERSTPRSRRKRPSNIAAPFAEARIKTLEDYATTMPDAKGGRLDLADFGFPEGDELKRDPLKLGH